ncbi:MULTISPECIES: hypothetical protein [Reichenbachiella]|uniref:Uncharacterized protein n=1 Tax=Reichenbachiella agariperforans TaxID=156994 RepID=A0A1M6T1W7_REIAG|nr:MULTISPECIES: hypothetical protein [Reichenbachiella]MBU2914808.1 hypothetical protein [Reichenbachiella agariperforans]RJE75187.1 hypothetical protein BGP76_18975 [Reichenbachiella sp. MSK19-1]SHK50955.1 hypothetical protein SAMN04488028_105251 [Reichenbachiella agariperforans]
MNVLANREIQRTAIHNIVQWVEEIDQREEILPLGNQDEMLALLENAKGQRLNPDEQYVAQQMLMNSVVH